MKLKVSRLFFIVIAVFGLLVVSFGGVQAQDQITVKLWMHDHPPREPLDNQHIAEFEKANPNIKVEYTIVPAPDWSTTLATAMASGAGPDLFNVDSFSVGDYYVQGNIVPVDAAAAGYADQQAIYDSYEGGKDMLAGATFNGQLYGLPTEWSAYACYTNNALWQKAGLDPNKDFPTTWEGLKDVAEKLTVRDANGAITQRGYDFRWGTSIFMFLSFNAMVQQLGGNMVDETNYTANIDTPQVKQVMQYWYDWANTWKLGGAQYTDDRTDFLAGNMAINCDVGSWFAPQADDAKIQYTIHPVPRWQNNVHDNGFASYGYMYTVNSQSSPDVQAAAWKLAGYLTSFPADYLAAAGLLQPKKDFVESDAFKNDPIMPVFESELTKDIFNPRIAGFQEVSDALQRARDRIISGGEDMDSVLADAQSEVSDILAQAKANGGVSVTETPATPEATASS
ncbi:MAG TPA: extracellular solute-binding protein [Phototrophicaceae bacterium]|nr:extracellular solute-binding protein [Phototrophicaceae bacterium]